MKQSDVIFYEVEGIGYDFVPSVLHRHLVDRWIRTNDQQSFQMIRRLIREEGILSGGSSGAVLAAALQAAKDLKSNQNCVVILADGIRNYMTKFVIDNWLEARQYKEIENEFDHWWWSHPVRELNIARPMSVQNDSSIAQALNFLKCESLQHVPIVNEGGTLDGFLNLKDLTKKVVSQNVKLHQSIKKVIFKQFRKVTETSSLGFVARVLETDEFVAIVGNGNYCTGVITHSDLLNFIAENSKKFTLNGNGV